KAIFVTPPNVFPLIVTTVPAAPLEGANDVIVGRTGSVSPALVPAGVVTVRLPVTAPAGKVALSWSALSTPNEIAAAPSLRAVAPVRFEPEIVSVSTAWAGLGATSVSFGVGLNTAALVAVPSGVVTESVPRVAVLGTFATTLVALALTGVALTPLN